MTGTISTPVKQLQMAINMLVVTEMSAMKYAQRMLPDKSFFKRHLVEMNIIALIQVPFYKKLWKDPRYINML
jgi:hypothetical protein